APVGADAHRLAVLDRLLDDRGELGVLLLAEADAAGVGPVLGQGLRAGRFAGQQLMAVGVEVADQGHVDAHHQQLLADPRDRRGRLRRVDGQAHQLRAGAPQLGHLLHRAGHVGRIGIGHGLDDHRGTTANGHPADQDPAGGTARPGSDGSGRRGLGNGIVLHVRILGARALAWPTRDEPERPSGPPGRLPAGPGIRPPPPRRAQARPRPQPTYPLYVANVAESPDAGLEVRDKYSGEVATRVAMADAATVERAIAAAVEAAPAMAALPAYRRQAVLEHCIARFRERAGELAEALCIEAGKPIRDARGEVTRLIDTFRIAAEEATRIEGQTVDLEISERGRGYRGVWKRVPIGPCSFITPFNFPLNLVAHKVAPAIAAGCPFVLKPAGKTPVGALIIA